MSNGSVQNAGLTPEAINRLVEGRQQFLFFLEKRIQSKAAAEDILQAAFVQLNLEKEDPSVTRRAWWLTVLSRASQRHHRLLPPTWVGRARFRATRRPSAEPPGTR